MQYRSRARTTWMKWTCTMVVGVMVVACFGQGQISSLLKPLQPRLFSIDRDRIPLSDALADLEKQTGNRVFDRRAVAHDPKIALTIDRFTFWKSLDAIARAADVRLSLYEDDGKIALVNGKYQNPPIHYGGMIRFAIKRIALQKNFLAGRDTCDVTFDAAWAPRIEPLYMEVGPSKIIYAANKNGNKSQYETPSHGTAPVFRKSAAEISLTYPGPARSAPQIESLRGTLSFVSPVEMLTFEFDRLAPISEPKDIRILKKNGYEVRITRLQIRQGRCSVDVKIARPAGDVEFESFQSWMGNNRVMLIKDDNKKSVLLPRADEEELLEPETATGAAIRYHFADLGELADWRFVCITPGRIVRFSVPYSFQKLPLP